MRSNGDLALSNTGIAIIGVGGCFPGAANVPTFWRNICNGHVAIREVPKHRWDPALYFSTNRADPEKTYSCIGGWLEPLEFDAKRFRIPPKTLSCIDDLQKLALTAVAEALEDAGLQLFPDAAEGRPFNRDRTAVILGNAMGGEAEDLTSLRVWFPEAVRALEESGLLNGLEPQARAAYLADFERSYKSRLPLVTEDSMPGELSNCITGRIANAFDLRGPNFTTDAACAASMAALKTAVAGLQAGEFDVAIIGGADRSMDPPTYVKFSKIGALSGDMSAPFDARANGFVMGEGVGVVVLRRLADAVRAGDRIYAVVRGVGAASDGKGKGMTAPNPRGQRMAVERAYQAAGISIASVGLFEAHGTSTTVGDTTELRVLSDLLREAGSEPRRVPIGSVKSMIGHLKSASGSASVIKTALAIFHKTLPPSANFQKAPPESPLQEGYLAVQCKAEPWNGAAPRRAGVSAFGFGGTNFHVILEEYVPGALVQEQPAAPVAVAVAAGGATGAELLAEITQIFAAATGYAATDLDPSHQLEADLGIDTVKQAELMGVIRERYGLARDEEFRLSETPTLQAIAAYVGKMRVPGSAGAFNAAEAASAPAAVGPTVLLFGGANTPAVVETAQRLLADAPAIPAAALAGRQACLQAPARLAFLAMDAADARAKVQDAGRRRAKMLAAQGIYLAEGTPLAQSGKIAFVFPGQGSQYLGMFKDLAAHYPVVAETFQQADEVLLPLIGERLSDIVWAAPTAEAAVAAADLRLRETQNCQPAMLTADVAMARLLISQGIEPAMVGGHSLGEYAACVAAGVLSFADALYAVSARGREMAGVRVEDNGKMAVVATDLERVQAVLAQVEGYVIPANINCHTQTVIAGASVAVESAMARFADAGIEARTIPVSHAFHCKIVAPAAEPLRRVLQGLDVRAPHVPILSNLNAEYYPESKEAIVDLMARQLASPVQFIAQMERMYRDGARIFIEVGPRRAITGFVRNVLGSRDHRAIATNHHKRPSVEGFLDAVAALASEGVPVRFVDAPPAAVEAVPSRSSNPVQMATRCESGAAAEKSVVVTGLATVLPCIQPLPEIGDDGLAGLFAGQNFIRPIEQQLRHAMLEKNVVRLNKAGGDFERLQDLTDVIQLAARLGELDLEKAYGLDPHWVDAFDATARLSVAVGIDALRDAGVPLVRHYRTTSTGKQLPDRWGLPPQVAKTTGVILASAFPGIDRLIDEVSRHAAAAGVARSAAQLEQFVEEAAGLLRDSEEAARLREKFARHAQALRDEANLYAFNRKFLFRILSLGHAQLAQAILAQGPNTQVNAACASGTQAIGIAVDWIRCGRCERVLVVSADDATNDRSLPWIGAGFLAAGAATTEPEVTRAAVPFGSQRNGMIVGAGAAAFVVEDEALAQARGIEPIVEVLTTHFANSAFHATRLDADYIKHALADVVDQVTAKTGWSRSELARRAFFMSHETYTPARGGSSAAEVEAIRYVFGESATDLLIANTKGYTGHPMAATVEDAVTMSGLQRQALPPIANLDDVDPAFTDLRFARGGAAAVEVGLRFAAGFGSQLALAAYRRRARTPARLKEAPAYEAWIAEQCGRSGAGLEIVGRTLRVAETGGVKPWELGVRSLEKMAPTPIAPEPLRVAAVTSVAPAAAEPTLMQAQPVAAVATELSREQLLTQLRELFAAQTGYNPADLEPTHALEADLGIDTVKQAEIMALIRARYGLPKDESFKLADVQSLSAIADYVAARRPELVPAADEALVAPLAPPVVKPVAVPAAPVVVERAKALPGASLAPQALIAELTQIFAAQTGYDAADLDPSHQLEADLGIDTVKQAEIFALVRERYGLPKDVSFKLADVPTLHAVAAYVMRQRVQSAAAVAAAPALEAKSEAAPQAAQAVTSGGRDALLEELKAIFAAQTGYDVADLDPAHQLEADLGIDTVKQAEVFALVRERFGLPKDETFRLADVQTLTAMVDYVLAQQGKSAGATAVPVVLPKAPEKAPAVVAAAGAAGAASREALIAELTQIFAAQTGYDVADLDPAHQLEADLGIDTVKQAEIMALVRERFGLPRDENFKLAQVQTLHAMADYVVAARGGLTPEPPEPPTAPSSGRGATRQALAGSGAVAAATTVAAAGVVTSIGSYQARAVLPVALAQRSAAERARTLAGRRVVVCGGDAAAQRVFAAALTQRGAEVQVLEGALEADRTLEKRLAAWGDTGAQDLLFLARSMASETASPLQLDAAAIESEVREVFRAVRALGRTQADKTKLGVLLVGRSAGIFGFHDASPAGLVLGALAGVAKTLAREWPGTRCLAADLDTADPLERSAEAALDAWTTEGPAELAWYQGRCWTLRRAGESSWQRVELPARAVVVASGGARGVTYRLLQEVVQAVSCRVVVLGRTAALAPEDSPLTGRSDDEVKQIARQAVQDAGERATPAALKRWIESHRTRVEIWHNLERLRSAGHDVELVVCDVADADALPAAVQHIQTRYGGVDLLIHGAGVEESKFIVDKDEKSFTRVFAPKATAALRLWEGFRPRRMVTMGSIAGRFGNAGQVDYAAANEVLAALARGNGGAVLNLAWTAWADVGMATRGSVGQVLGSLGVDLLPAEVGARLGAALLWSNAAGDVVVAGRLGTFDDSEAAFMEAEQQESSSPAPSGDGSMERALPPLFSRVEAISGGGQALICTLDPTNDPGLADHRIANTPVLPGVLGVELMAAAAGFCVGKPVTALETLRFDVPLKLFRDQAVQARVEVVVRGETADVKVVTLFNGPGGKQSRKEHFAATALFAAPPAMAWEGPDNALDMAREAGINRSDVYERYFHGPSFHVLAAINTLGENGVEVCPITERPRWLAAAAHQDFITQPLLREAGFQAAGLWEMVELGRMALPAGAQQISFGRAIPPGARLLVEARCTGSDAQGARFDVWVRDEDGAVYDVMRGYHTTLLRPLGVEERFGRRETSGHKQELLSVDVAQVQSIFRRDPMATLERYLSPPERLRFGTLKVEKRQAEWLAVRIAAKRLIRDVCFIRQGRQVPYTAITLHRDSLGAPVVEVVGASDVTPLVSMSHSAGVATAFLSLDPHTRPGVDVEAIERRDPSFAENYFSVAEREQASSSTDADQALTEIWAVKEATLKALGVGARVDFNDLEALRQDGKWRVTLRREAAQRAQELGAVGSPQVDVSVDGRRVLACVLLPVGKSAAVTTVIASESEVIA